MRAVVPPLRTAFCVYVEPKSLMLVTLEPLEPNATVTTLTFPARSVAPAGGVPALQTPELALEPEPMREMPGAVRSSTAAIAVY